MAMDKGQIKEFIARRAARELHDGDFVNLGIGLPTMIPEFLPPDVHVVLEAEDGIVGAGPRPDAEHADPRYVVDAGGQPASCPPGGAYISSVVSFGLIRGGHVDATVLGALQVDQEGSLANWIIPGKMVPGMGGAMDLTVGAKKVFAATQHFDGKGCSKLLRKCALPLTAAREVDYVVTDIGLFEVRNGAFVLKEYFKPYTVEYILEKTDADIVVDKDCREVDLG